MLSCIACFHACWLCLREVLAAVLVAQGDELLTSAWTLLLADGISKEYKQKFRTLQFNLKVCGAVAGCCWCPWH